MLRKLNIFLISTLIVFSFFTCKKEEQTVDSPHQLFRPAVLQIGVNANVATFSWIPIKGAKYSLDIAKDNLQFTTDVQNYIIEGKAEFTTENLWSLTTYSVRIKCLSSDPNIKDSEYKTATFVTQLENIFSTPSANDIGADHILMKWDATKTVTHIVISNGTAENTTVLLSDQDILAGQANISGLTSGTSYVFKIYNGEMLRGTVTTKTL